MGEIEKFNLCVNCRRMYTGSDSLVFKADSFLEFTISESFSCKFR